jgi:hypothetical protein
MVEFLCVQTASSRVRRIELIVILVWVVVMLLAAGDAHGQNSAATIERRGLILAMNRPLDSEAEQQFRGVVAQSVRWSLERQKLGVIEKAAPSYDVANFQNPIDVLDSSVTGEVDFILLTEYASRGQDLEIRMAWYNPQSGEKTEEVIRRGRKDLVLDKIIREALNELLVSVESSLDALEPREFVPVDNPAVATTVDFQTNGAVNGTAKNPVQVQPYSPGNNNEIPSPLLPESDPNQPAKESVPERTRRFEIGLGCAPFVATGVASEYFKLGVMPVLNLSYLFQGELSRFGLGLYGGFNYFTATGDLASAETFLIPTGVSLRYEIGSERYPSVVFGITSGPALLMMISSNDEKFLGLTFFGRGSLGVRLPVGRTFAFLIEAGYDFYWEQPHPIMGFSPSVSTTIRL